MFALLRSKRCDQWLAPLQATGDRAEGRAVSGDGAADQKAVYDLQVPSGWRGGAAETEGPPGENQWESNDIFWHFLTAESGLGDSGRGGSWIWLLQILQCRAKGRTLSQFRVHLGLVSSQLWLSCPGFCRSNIHVKDWPVENGVSISFLIIVTNIYFVKAELGDIWVQVPDTSLSYQHLKSLLFSLTKEEMS